MKSMKTVYKIIAIGLFVTPFLYYLWTLRPVEILSEEALYNSDPQGVHGLFIGNESGFPGGYYYNVVVDHLPLTKWDQVHWYIVMESEIKVSLHIPDKIAHHISIWDVGGGFINPHRSGDGDLVCFRNIKSENNCIEKNHRLSIDVSEYGQEKFDFSSDDRTWILTKQGELVTYE
ncbi:DUF943 family protein [Buttiauxella sp. WJP83]|uniref:DUF943 family protein n=1 Tax=Buttiauxella sp. WJP83 TaxID=2986951 RepID=UPI0022DD9CFF|nr:DUF943 family protein [Buttiauxella sp. WJP83]WBM71182.1 DUF943 family protein [Buttiauxella sp. WJP83]